jgi:hypothetical protein
VDRSGTPANRLRVSEPSRPFTADAVSLDQQRRSLDSRSSLRSARSGRSTGRLSLGNSPYVQARDLGSPKPLGNTVWLE